MSLFRRKAAREQHAAHTMAGLRERALYLLPDEIGVRAGEARPDVWGILMETGYAKAAASLVCFADGSTSLYFSNGGGIIGAGEHRTVRSAADDFLSAAQQHIDLFTPTNETPLPELGRVRFYVRTFDGIRTAEAGEQDLGLGRHPLSRVFHAGHVVIAAVREATPHWEDA